jgi:RNA polymerase sigma factor (sigma-70 family)
LYSQIILSLTSDIKVNLLIDHLFRHEYGKLVSILTRIFGSHNLQLAEDVVQDSLLEAFHQWQYGEYPDNPAAWLFRVAKNKAINIIHREKYKKQYILITGRSGFHELTEESAFDHFFAENEIQDDQLRMIFTCCHPAISPDSQVALALKTLCGFGISEIARAFLTTDENIHKRLVRARQKIREVEIPYEIPAGRDLDERLDRVLETIYLLFNEGYSATKGEEIIRYEICEEAIRLTKIILDADAIRRKAEVYALLSLMLLNASRFRSRQNGEGSLLTMEEQDRSLWDKGMQDSGVYYLQEAIKNNATGTHLVLAMISAHYCIAPDYESINWESVLSLFDVLLKNENSPVLWLNRAVVISKLKGPADALKALEKVHDNPVLKSYHLFYITRAEFHLQLNQLDLARLDLQTGLSLTRVISEQDLLKNKLTLVISRLDRKK